MLRRRRRKKCSQFGACRSNNLQTVVKKLKAEPSLYDGCHRCHDHNGSFLVVCTTLQLETPPPPKEKPNLSPDDQMMKTSLNSLTYYLTETPAGTVWHKPASQCLLMSQTDPTGCDVAGFYCLLLAAFHTLQVMIEKLACTLVKTTVRMAQPTNRIIN